MTEIRPPLGALMSAEREYAYFIGQVHARTGMDLSQYKQGQMERRIRSMAERVKATSLLEYWKLLAGNDTAMADFLDRVTINVSELFRNPEKFEELRQFVLPELLRRKAGLQVWSAGCSYGAEAYSLRILLAQLSPTLNHRVLASDIDIRILARAREGIFTAEDMRNVPEAVQKRFFTREGELFRVMAAARQGVEFQQHNLLKDRFPTGMDIILCRNVVIYFTEDAKASLFERFYQALRPGGYLLVGNTERIHGAREIGFTSPRAFFYQRPEGD
jgi:chemotaxis protein methyltransferase CheR